jgi:hypothetical protein
MASSNSLALLVGRLGIDADHLHVGDAEKQVPVLDRGIERAQRLVGAEILRRTGGPGVTVLGRFQRAAVPIEPDAPGWLMITMVWPSDFSISPATSLVI